MFSGKRFFVSVFLFFTFSYPFSALVDFRNFVRSKPTKYLGAKYGTDEPSAEPERPDDPELENPDGNSENICQSNSCINTPVGKLLKVRIYICRFF